MTTLSYECKQGNCDLFNVTNDQRKQIEELEAKITTAVGILEDRSLAPTHRAIRAREILLGIGRME
jgi:hypothetical protein